jgi:hypothetical protein
MGGETRGYPCGKKRGEPQQGEQSIDILDA